MAGAREKHDGRVVVGHMRRILMLRIRLNYRRQVNFDRFKREREFHTT